MTKRRKEGRTKLSMLLKELTGVKKIHAEMNETGKTLAGSIKFFQAKSPSDMRRIIHHLKSEPRPIYLREGRIREFILEVDPFNLSLRDIKDIAKSVRLIRILFGG